VFAQISYDQLAAVTSWTSAGVAAGAAPLAVCATLVGAVYLASLRVMEPGGSPFDSVQEKTEIESEPFSHQTVLMASVSLWSITKSVLADVMKKLNPWA